MPEVAILLIAVLFGVYGWLSSVELGVGLLRLWPGQIPASRNRQLFTPLWEITNVFLVFGFTGFAVFFNNALVSLSSAVFNTLALAIGLLLLRACLVLYIYYHRGQLGWNWANLLFVLTSLLIPLCFVAIGVYLLTGQSFWQTGSGWLLLATAMLGILALALSFMQLLGANSRLRTLAAILALLFASFGSLGLQLVLPSNFEHLGGRPFLVWAGLMDLTLLYLAVVLLWHKEKWLWAWLSLVTVASPLIWAWSNRPYLIFPSTSLVAGYGAQAYGRVAVIGIAAIFPVILLGLALFAKLYTENSDKR